MTYLLRHAAVTAMVMLILSGCGRPHAADDGHDHDAEQDQVVDDPHAGHDHAQYEPDAHAGDVRDPGQDETDAQGEDERDDGHDGEAEEFIRLDPRELSEFGIRLAIAEPGALSVTSALSGEIVLNPDRVAHVVSRAGGIGTEVLRTIGDRVEAGEMLAVLNSPELAESKAEYLARAAHAALAATDLARAETIYANTTRLLEIVAEAPDVESLRRAISGLDIGAKRGDLITAYAELRAAEAIYGREKTLFERQISSESEYLMAESGYQKAVAGFRAARDDLAFANRRELEIARRSKLVADVSLRAAERRLHAFGLAEHEVRHVEEETDTELDRYEVRAPIRGRIIERHLVRGESVEAGEQVFVIADLSSVWAELTLYQRDLDAVQEGQTVRVLGTHGQGSTDATIDYISPILDEQTRTTTARVVLDNVDGNWRPGMFIRAEVVSLEGASTVIVPRSALQKIDEEMVVFVETEEGLARRDVQVGRHDSEYVEIIAGLRPGDRYVVTGGLALKAELNKAALEHAGHAH